MKGLEMVPLLEFPNSENPRDWLKYVCHIESYLKKIQDKNNNLKQFEEQSDTFLQMSVMMMESAKYIFSNDLRLYLKFNVDQKVWKTGLYDNICIIRSGLGSAVDKKRGILLLSTFVDAGCSHFNDLIEIFQKIVPMDLKNVMRKSGFLSQTDASKTQSVKLVYKLFIYIGDLWRYSFQIQPMSQYRKHAMEYYEIARIADKSQGRAFHQLGLIAQYMNDGVGIAYYFLRDYLSETPTETGRQELLEVFYKAHEGHKQLKDGYWYALSKENEKCVRFKRNFQREVWMLPEKARHDKMPTGLEAAPPTKVQHIASLSTKEVYDRFAQTYVLLLGKVFTNIGMDTFEEVAEEVLVYFEGVLKKDVKMSFARFTQIVTLGLNVVDSLCRKDERTSSHSVQISCNRSIAIVFILEMFSIAVERLYNLTLLCDWKNPQIDFLSSGVVLWCNWLYKNNRLWNKNRCRPLFSVRRLEYTKGTNKANLEDDVWMVFAKLMMRLEALLFRKDLYVFPIVSKTKTEKTFLPITPLPESIILSGAIDLNFDIYKSKYFTTGRFIGRRAQLYLRLKEIHSFGANTLVDFGVLLSTRDSNNISVYAPKRKLLEPKKVSEECGLNDKNFWFWAKELLPKERIFDPKRPDCNNARVILRKKPVKKVPQHPKCYDWTNIQKIWWRRQQRGYHVDILVRPKRIIVDTNCYINKLDWVKKLIKVFPVKIILPISVIMELKGLSKGGLRTRYYKKFANNLNGPEAREKFVEGNATAELVKKAMEFIDKNMKDFQVITTTGRRIPVKSIYERVNDEFFNPRESNDDRIMKTAKCVEINDKSLRRLDNPRRIFRTTVILTGDRCLRIRSFAEDLPGREIESVVFWASRFGAPIDPNAKPFRHYTRYRRPYKGSKQNRK